MVNATLRGSAPVGPLSFNAYWLRGIGAQAARYAPLPLRVMLACTYLFHGLPKLAGGHAAFVAHLAQLGFAAPSFWAWVVGFVEVVGGFMLLFGVAAGLASIALVIEMIVAVAKIHVHNGFDVSRGGSEFPLLLIAALLAVFIGGAGAFSLDESWSDHDAKVARRAPPGP